MKRIKKYIFIILLIFLSAWMTGVQINRVLKVNETFTSESIRLTEGTLKAETIESALENEKKLVHYLLQG